MNIKKKIYRTDSLYLIGFLLQGRKGVVLGKDERNFLKEEVKFAEPLRLDTVLEKGDKVIYHQDETWVVFY